MKFVRNKRVELSSAEPEGEPENIKWKQTLKREANCFNCPELIPPRGRYSLSQVHPSIVSLDWTAPANIPSRHFVKSYCHCLSSLDLFIL